MILWQRQRHVVVERGSKCAYNLKICKYSVPHTQKQIPTQSNMWMIKSKEFHCRHETWFCTRDWDTNKRLWMPSAHRWKDYHKVARKQLGTQSHWRTTTMEIIKSYSERIHWFEGARAQDVSICSLYIFYVVLGCLRWWSSFVWIWQIISLFSLFSSPPVAPK